MAFREIKSLTTSSCEDKYYIFFRNSLACSVLDLALKRRTAVRAWGSVSLSLNYWLRRAQS
jgi:hypothetical protein